MTTLNDDCLLYVLRFLDPVTWISISQVCTRWKQLALTKLNKITEIYMKNPQDCDKIPRKNLKMILTNKNKLYSVLQYIGPYVRSVILSDPNSKIITFNRQYSYYIMENVNDRELIQMLSKTCKNIVDLQVGKNYVNLMELLKSNKHLKKLILPDENLKMFSSCSHESIDEVIWEVQANNIRNFNWFFPSVRKLTLFINATLCEAEMILNTILRFAKSLKSISVFINTFSCQKHYFTMLSDISTLIQLEELRISVRKYPNSSFPQFLEFKVNTVKKLISACQNLRIVEFDSISLGSADINPFFKLPRLEELTIVKASSFVLDCPSENMNNLTKLEIHFHLKNDGKACSYLCKIVKQMSALKYLQVDGITQEEASTLTCSAIASGVLHDKDVFIRAQAPNASMKVYKTVKSAFKPEPLILWITPQKNDYDNDINEVVKHLKDCLLVKEEFEIYKKETSLFKQYTDIYKCCEIDEFYESDIENEENEWEDNYSDSSFEDTEEGADYYCTIS